jgi:hypothetical protein
VFRECARGDVCAKPGGCPKLLKVPPEIVAEIIVQAMERRKPRVLVGTDAKIVSFIERLASVSSWKFPQRLKPRARCHCQLKRPPFA